jgi:hypothetical protein
MSGTSWRLGLCGLLCLVGACAQAQAATSEPGFAVVELFTSEGCSSCPPADALLGQLSESAAQTGRLVYTLAFHVNYWDNHEWRDPYSTLFATQRQQTYAAALGGRGLYTPQMVVNGRHEFIGSHADQAQAKIAAALAEPSSLRLQLSARRSAGRVLVDYRVSGTSAADSVLRLALVQAEGVGHVRAGENAGLVLRHVHVVRAFASVPLTAAVGSSALSWPSELDAQAGMGATVVAYVQQRADMRISAAARTSIQ